MFRKFISIQLALLLGVLLIAGCSTVTNTDSTTGVLNDGEITGTVYLVDAVSLISGDYQKAEGATVFVDDITVVTNADGSFTISGIPEGEVSIGALLSGYSVMVVTTSSNSVNLYLTSLSSISMTGSAELSGSVTGVTSSDSVSISLRSTNGQQSYNSNYDPATQTFSYTDAADGGTVYLSGSTIGANPLYGYCRLDAVSSDTSGISLALAPGKEISGSVVIPEGFYGVTIVGGIFSNAFIGPYGYSDYVSFGNSEFSITVPASLYSGDAYGLNFYCYALDRTMLKTCYDVDPNESVVVDFTSLPQLVISGSSPEEGEIVDEYPTFAWDAIDGDNIIYFVIGYENSGNGFMGVTRNTSMTLPSAVELSDGTKYNWYIMASEVRNMNIDDLYNDYNNIFMDYYCTTETRTFTYSTSGSSSESVKPSGDVKPWFPFGGLRP